MPLQVCITNYEPVSADMSLIFQHNVQLSGVNNCLKQNAKIYNTDHHGNSRNLPLKTGVGSLPERR